MPATLGPVIIGIVTIRSGCSSMPSPCSCRCRGARTRTSASEKSLMRPHARSSPRLRSLRGRRLVGASFSWVMKEMSRRGSSCICCAVSSASSIERGRPPLRTAKRDQASSTSSRNVRGEKHHLFVSGRLRCDLLELDFLERVERGCRLVEQQHVGLVHKRRHAEPTSRRSLRPCWPGNGQPRR
jgi:hypothetical protein